MKLPRILVIDDLFGRRVEGGVNEQRRNLCGEYLLEDVTGDESEPRQRIRAPIAEVVFCRGQKPALARVGDFVENDTTGTLDQVRSGWEKSPRWALVLLDLCFYTGRVTPASNRKASGIPEGREGDDTPSGYFGLVLLRAIREFFPALPVAILSSMPRSEVAQDFARAGAVGFLARGEDGKEALQEFLQQHALLPDESGLIAGESVPLLEALRAARRVGPTRRNVLIRGERGTGKELLASYLHRHVPVVGASPFVTVDAGTLHPALYASEIFGHVRGAFTGADRDRSGRLVDADGGDLFLDEIGNIPYDVQTGLLRAIETREVVPVGGRSGKKVDVRVISATNEDLEVRILEKGGFRADLLDRLREGGTILLPSLRERVDDIPQLALRFIREAERAAGARERIIDPEALEELCRMPWPGNVRELRSVLFEAVAANRDVEVLVRAHLRTALRVTPPEEPRFVTSQPEADRNQLLADLLQKLRAFEFSALEVNQLLGKLPEIEASYAEMVGRYLSAALHSQLRHNAANPEGRLLIHPAIVLMTGAPRLSATKAYDLIIRLRHLPGASAELWAQDELLREAYERAISRRRRN